jgi:hypothetical protein
MQLRKKTKAEARKRLIAEGVIPDDAPGDTDAVGDSAEQSMISCNSVLVNESCENPCGFLELMGNVSDGLPEDEQEEEETEENITIVSRESVSVSQSGSEGSCDFQRTPFEEILANFAAKRADHNLPKSQDL